MRVFWNSSPGNFSPKFIFSSFNMKLCILGNSKVLILNMAIVFFIKFWRFWSETQFFLFLHETLQFDEFGDADFKYDNSYLKLLPKNTQICHFSLKYNKNFCFCPKICIFKTFKSVDFKYDHRIFKFLPKNPN